MIDTHAHLCDQAFGNDLAAVLERARRAGVEAVIAVGENLEDARRNLELATEYPGMVFPAGGLFPTVLDLSVAERTRELIRREAEAFVAIGEVGLDHWKVKDERDRGIQREIFGSFIDLSLELDLPLNVHSRSAGATTVQLLLDRGAERVQMHAFDGRAASARPGVEAGFFFSVPPSIVRSRQKQKLVKALPIRSLLVETDSPVLAAERESRNEPAEVFRSLQAISELKGLPLAEVAESVRENTLRLYGSRLDQRGAGRE